MSLFTTPPVSATADKVFFRDGDTKGSGTSVSFFSVSPDDRRIAVLTEDFSASSTIGLSLQVEDLNGGGSHHDIYTTTTPRARRRRRCGRWGGTRDSWYSP